MRHRAPPSGITLSPRDAAVIRGMLARGDRHHDIAAFFGVNPGRVAQVNDGSLHVGIPAASFDELPPRGPYLQARREYEKSRALR